MTASFQVRAARPADVPDLILLASTAFRDTYDDGDNSADIEDYVTRAFTPASFMAILDDRGSELLIAHDASGPAGYVHVRRSPPPAGVTGERPIELSRLYLRKDTIGRGYGAVLMHTVIDIAQRRDCDMIWLAVYDRNTRAREFYRRFGFVDVGYKDFLFGGQMSPDPVMAMPLART